MKDEWTARIAAKLVGRKITAVGYMTKPEMNAAGWYQSCLVIELDDGQALYPMADDEGNGPGALATTYEDLPTIPVMWEGQQ